MYTLIKKMVNQQIGRFGSSRISKTQTQTQEVTPQDIKEQPKIPARRFGRSVQKSKQLQKRARQLREIRETSIKEAERLESQFFGKNITTIQAQTEFKKVSPLVRQFIETTPEVRRQRAIKTSERLESTIILERKQLGILQNRLRGARDSRTSLIESKIKQKATLIRNLEGSRDEAKSGAFTFNQLFSSAENIAQRRSLRSSAKQVARTKILTLLKKGGLSKTEAKKIAFTQKISKRQAQKLSPEVRRSLFGKKEKVTLRTIPAKELPGVILRDFGRTDKGLSSSLKTKFVSLVKGSPEKAVGLITTRERFRKLKTEQKLTKQRNVRQTSLNKQIENFNKEFENVESFTNEKAFRKFSTRRKSLEVEQRGIGRTTKNILDLEKQRQQRGKTTLSKTLDFKFPKDFGLDKGERLTLRKEVEVFTNLPSDIEKALLSQRDKQKREITKRDKIVAKVGSFAISAPVAIPIIAGSLIEGIEKFTDPTATLSKRKSGAIETGLSGALLVAPPLIKARGEVTTPKIILEPKPIPKTVGESVAISLKSGERKIAKGGFLTITTTKARKGKVITKSKLTGLPKKVENIVISEPSVKLDLAPQLTIRDRKISGLIISGGKVGKRQSKTTINILRGEVSPKSINLDTTKISKLPKTTQKAVEELSNIPNNIGKITMKLPKKTKIRSGALELTKIGDITKSGKFTRAKLGRTKSRSELAFAQKKIFGLKTENKFVSFESKIFKEKIGSVDTTFLRFRKPKKASQLTGKSFEFDIELKNIAETPSFSKGLGRRTTKQISKQKLKQNPRQVLTSTQSLLAKTNLPKMVTPTRKAILKKTGITESQRISRLPTIVGGGGKVGISRFSGGQTQIPVESFNIKSFNIPTSKSIPKFKSLGSTKQFDIQLNRQISRQLPRQQPRPLTKSITKLIPKQKPRQVQKSITKQIPKLINKPVPKIIPKIPILRVPKIPRGRRLLLPPPFRLKPGRTRVKQRRRKTTQRDIALAEGFTARILRFKPQKITSSQLPRAITKFQTPGLRRRPLLIPNVTIKKRKKRRSKR